MATILLAGISEADALLACASVSDRWAFWGSIAASATVGEMCVNDNLDALAAELQVIELWDRAGEGADPGDELDRAGFKARRLRRLEIIREIDSLTRKET